jgi:hypothetical protein
MHAESMIQKMLRENAARREKVDLKNKNLFVWAMPVPERLPCARPEWGPALLQTPVQVVGRMVPGNHGNHLERRGSLCRVQLAGTIGQRRRVPFPRGDQRRDESHQSYSRPGHSDVQSFN